MQVIKADVSVKRAAAFCKRLMQAALHANSNWACGALLLLSEVLKSQPALWSAVQQPEEQDDNEEHFQDAPDRSGQGLGLNSTAMLKLEAQSTVDWC